MVDAQHGQIENWERVMDLFCVETFIQLFLEGVSSALLFICKFYSNRRVWISSGFGHKREKEKRGW